MTDDQLHSRSQELARIIDGAYAGECIFSDLVVKALDESLRQVRDQVTAERNPGEKIFTHKHLDFHCVENGCQSLFLEQADKRITELERQLAETEQRVRREMLELLLPALVKAWAKYTWLFGEPPHGTEKQIAAMLELLPEELRRAAEEISQKK